MVRCDAMRYNVASFCRHGRAKIWGKILDRDRLVHKLRGILGELEEVELPLYSIMYYE